MSKETKYGVISDIHEDPRIIIPAIQKLKSLGAEKLLVNGDIGGWYGEFQESQKYTAFILQEVAKSGLEAYVQPGSHELLLVYDPVIEYFSNKFKDQIIDATKVPKVEQNGHALVFLPGSDFLCKGEYQIGSQEGIPTGKYVQTPERLLRFNTWQEGIRAVQQKIGKLLYYSNMHDLKKHVNQPEKTIVVCHVPRKFDSIEEAVDMAEFGEAVIDFPLQDEMVRRGSIYPIQTAKKIHEAGYPVALKRENRGNKDLAKLYDELGITKSVTGHFHESSHRANDKNSSHVPENTYVTELFWNSGHLDRGYTGILTVDGEKVKYQNVTLAGE